MLLKTESHGLRAPGRCSPYSPVISAISIALGSVAAVSSAADSISPDDRQSALTPALYIVQAESLNTADQSVVRVNAKVEQEFEIIHSVSAYLTPRQVARLCETNGSRVRVADPWRATVRQSRSLSSII